MPGAAPARRRRWPYVLVAVVVLVGVLGSVGWYVAVPHWRPGLEAGEAYGVDVSRHQGEVDWDAVAADGIDFAYVKASEGGDLVDLRFAENWERAGEARLERGAYHYFTLCRPGADQARNFLATVPPDPTALRPAVDLEFPGNCRARPPRAEVAREIDAFLEQVERAWGRPVLVYSEGGWDDRYPGTDLGRPLWDRRLWVRPDSAWEIWQVSAWARVEGVDGGVDLNVRAASG